MGNRIDTFRSQLPKHRDNFQDGKQSNHNTAVMTLQVFNSELLEGPSPQNLFHTGSKADLQYKRLVLLPKDNPA